MWISRKHGTALKLPDLIPPGPVFEGQMSTVLLTLLPSHFDGVANEIRANPPGDWRKIESRLLDFDKVASLEKREVQGRVYTAEAVVNDSLERMQRQLDEVTTMVRAVGRVIIPWCARQLAKRSKLRAGRVARRGTKRRTVGARMG